MLKISRLTVFALLAWHAPAQATSRSWTLPGSALTVASPCARQVDIEPDSALHGAIRITATKAQAQALAGLRASGGGRVTLTGPATQCDGAGACTTTGNACPDGWYLLGHGRRMMIEIAVPAGTPITIQEAGATDYRIGAVGGTLNATLAGAGDLAADDLAALSATLTGSGDLSAGQVGGTLLATLAGSGDLSVARAKTSAAKLTLSGTGDAAIGAGALGAVTAVLAGGGDFTAPAAASLQLASTGTGDATLQRVDGPVHAALLGSGNLALGRVSGDVATERGGPGDLTIGALAGKLTQTGPDSGDTRVGHAAD